MRILLVAMVLLAVAAIACQSEPAAPEPLPTYTPYPTNTPYPTPTPVPTATLTPTPTLMPSPSRPPTPVPPPNLRHLDSKQYMLELINRERAEAGVLPVVLGDNYAAQMHAEASLANCISSHWGPDGLKPYMRYSLAGGHQSNGENVAGRDYCVKDGDGYLAIRSVKEEVGELMEAWMASPGHRRNLLYRTHRKVNIGLTWDHYNIHAVQHFEGDFVELGSSPALQGGVLSMSGSMKNGALFDHDHYIDVQIFYDPPPRPLTRGQLSRTYCYSLGLPVAYVREPAAAGRVYTDDKVSFEYNPCPDPYDVPGDARAPESYDEATAFWQQSYDTSQARLPSDVPVTAITASRWETDGATFSITADIDKVLAIHGAGVYTVILWGSLDGEIETISKYSIFHDRPRPEGYD